MKTYGHIALLAVFVALGIAGAVLTAAPPAIASEFDTRPWRYETVSCGDQQPKAAPVDRCVRLTANLAEDGFNWTLDPFEAVDGSQHIRYIEGDNRFVLEALDRHGVVVASGHVMPWDGVGYRPAYRLDGLIVLPGAAVTVRFRSGDRVLASRSATNGAPKVAFIAPKKGSTLSGAVLLARLAIGDPDGDPITGTIERWTGSEWEAPDRSWPGPLSAESLIDLGQFTTGLRQRLRVRYSDGFHTGIAYSGQFRLARRNDPPKLKLLHPEAAPGGKRVVYCCSYIRFTAETLDANHFEPTKIRWLYGGKTISRRASFATAMFNGQFGGRILKVEATDRYGNRRTRAVRLWLTPNCKLSYCTDPVEGGSGKERFSSDCPDRLIQSASPEQRCVWISLNWHPDPNEPGASGEVTSFDVGQASGSLTSPATAAHDFEIVARSAQGGETVRLPVAHKVLRKRDLTAGDHSIRAVVRIPTGTTSLEVVRKGQVIARTTAAPSKVSVKTSIYVSNPGQLGFTWSTNIWRHKWRALLLYRTNRRAGWMTASPGCGLNNGSCDAYPPELFPGRRVEFALYLRAGLEAIIRPVRTIRIPVRRAMEAKITYPGRTHCHRSPLDLEIDARDPNTFEDPDVSWKLDGRLVGHETELTVDPKRFDAGWHTATARVRGIFGVTKVVTKRFRVVRCPTKPAG